ncbi:MAG: hypothetical protein M1377_03640 [Deltaproteobacteria bacterium]|nr:hypothetical protein [Deltaproteobacteria bacterium]
MISQTFDLKKRNILPRWNHFSTACLIGDVLPARKREEIVLDRDEIAEKSKRWVSTKHPIDAVDLVGTCIVLNEWEKSVAQEAAQYIVNHPSDVSITARDMAALYVSDPDTRSRESFDAILAPPDLHGDIGRLKRHVRSFPHDAIAWADLSYSYALIGLEKKARNAMRTAYALSPSNRFLVRSAARCFAHFEDPEEAIWRVRRSPLRKVDPMVISAEVALSQLLEKSPRNMKIAHTATTSGMFSNRSLSELHVALATLESREGYTRSAKKHAMKSLLDPNENVLAQIESLNDRVSGFVKDLEMHSGVLATYEADAQRSYKLGNFNEAYRSALQWFRYQPFSARPAVMASFVASLFLDNQEDAIRVITEAKKAEPNSFLLNNNHVCSLALLNKVEEAADVLSKIQIGELDDQRKRIYLATTGLVAYRQGNIALGEEKYREAIEGFKMKENYRSLVIATFYQAREIVRIKGSRQSTAMDQVLALARKYKINDMVSVIEKMCGQNGKG